MLLAARLVMVEHRHGLLGLGLGLGSLGPLGLGLGRGLGARGLGA